MFLQLAAVRSGLANDAATGGYEGTYISGLALAGDQVIEDVANPVYNVNTDGAILVHGGRLGVEARW